MCGNIVFRTHTYTFINTHVYKYIYISLQRNIFPFTQIWIWHNYRYTFVGVGFHHPRHSFNWNPVVITNVLHNFPANNPKGLAPNSDRPATYTIPNMMTSSNGNMFRVTGHLCGEFTGHRWIPLTKTSDAEFYFSCCFCFGRFDLSGLLHRQRGQ